MNRSQGLAHGRLSGAATAISFLTVLPISARATTAPGGIAKSVAWFPLIGALIGGLAGAVRVAAQPAFGPAVASVLSLIVLVGITGALHQDGLADTADGLGVRGDRERRLAAMRDSAIGAFGVLALIAWALLFLTVLATLSDTQALRALIAACALARWAALLHAAATPAARPDGLGAPFAPPPLQLAVATVLAVAAATLSCGALPGLAALGAAVLVAGLSATAARQAIGGRSGDTLGATIAVTEVAVSLALLAVWHP
jgi:adenosylcobinamide-GDP ribazoletransferase